MSHVITIPTLTSAKITYGFISRTLPNCSFHYSWQSKPDPQAENNRKLVLQALNLDHHQFAITNQVHGKTCLVIDKAPEFDKELEADGQVTASKNIVIAVKTADCVPVLFYDEQAEVIGGCHAGWRGAIGGILEETIVKMIAKGASLENIVAIIGPCIHQESYEVDSNFYQQFLAENQRNQEFFIDSTKSLHYMFDLPGYVINRLKTSGLSQIHDSKLDTYSNEDKFFSYRRSTLRNQQLEGSILSVIGFNSAA